MFISVFSCVYVHVNRFTHFQVKMCGFNFHPSSCAVFSCESLFLYETKKERKKKNNNKEKKKTLERWTLLLNSMTCERFVIWKNSSNNNNIKSTIHDKYCYYNNYDKETVLHWYKWSAALLAESIYKMNHWRKSRDQTNNLCLK